jgi:predicted O-linked N-acetylglucosamine transferase (SPINDLY family)
VDLHALGRSAVALHQQGRLAEAESLYRQVIAADPRLFPPLYLLGVLRLQQGDPAEAAALLERALAINPNDPAAQTQFGMALIGQRRFADALIAFSRALALAPGATATLLGRGTALRALGRTVEALADHEAALARDPGNADAWNGRGALLRSLKRSDEALDSFNRAIALWPDFAESLNNRGDLYWSDRQDYHAAVADLARALALDPARPWLRGNLLHLRMMGADWNGLEQQIALVHDGVRAGLPVVQPFIYQAIAEHPDQSQACSRIWVRENFPLAAAAPPPWRGHGKIRIGYVAGEFHEQALSFLLAGLFECHDRDRFDVIAFNNGGRNDGAMRQRLVAAFDKFIDIDMLSDPEAAARICAEEIDILINLNGYFGMQRTGLFALRPAPIQVSYMGSPFTLGLPAMDYVLADRIVVPEDERHFFDEQVVYLPGTYWANDSKRAIAERVPSRAECGLPDAAFVFCNFNNSYKLTPATFALWMRILKQVPGSVLWLWQFSSPAFADNIRREAAAQGVTADRLVFAGLVPSEENLARLKLADLSLDSLPYNAHTTAADVLWTGVPILTLKGTTWPGRVASSLLHAVGLPELVTDTEAAFEAKAVALARDPAGLAALKQKLAQNRLTTPLFDTARWTRHVEAAYEQMQARSQRGEAPAAFSVTPLA